MGNLRADEVWTNADLGIVGATGSASYNSSTDVFTIEGAGAGFSYASDGGQFVYLPMEGNSEIVAKITSQSSSNYYASAGLMMRQSLNDDSKSALVSVSPGNGVNFTWRSDAIIPASTVLGPSLAAPIWLRLVKSGNSLAGYQSPDGVSWSSVGTRTVVFSGTYYVGLAVSSAQVGVLNTGVFERISVMSNVPQVSSSLKMWLRSDAGVIKDGSGKVSLWEDQSGSGNHVKQAVSASQPTWADNTFNTKPVLQFDGGDVLAMAADSSDLKPSALTVIVVGKQTNAGNWAPYVMKCPTSWLSGYGLVTRNITSGGFWSSNYSTGNAGIATDTGYHAYVGRYAAANNKVEFFKDGGTAAIRTPYSTAITHSTNPLKIGSDGTLFLTGEVAEVLIYDRALTDDERLDIDAYLYQKYGVGTSPALATPASNIPSGTYSSAQTVTLSGPPGSAIYYTTNGSTPTTSSTLYTGPIVINASGTLKAIAVKDGYQVSPLLTKTYTIDGATGYVVREGLMTWLKADAGIVKDGSSKVSRWEDQSGRSNDVEQATGANQPTWTDNILNTKPVVRFDGTSDKLMMSDRSDLKPSALTLVVVGKQTNTGAWAPYVVKSSSSYWTNGYGLTTSSYPSSAGMWVSSLSSGYVVPPVDTNYHTYFGRYAPGNGKVELYRDGVGLTPKSYSSAINHSTAALGIGGDGDLAYLGGDIAEVMIYNRALNDNERQDIEAYLYQKYTIGTQPTVATPTASVGSGTYSSAQTVTLSGPVGATIYYTTNGSTPTTSSTPYTVPVPISVTSTLKAIAVKDGYQVSPLLTKTYTIDGATGYVVREGLMTWLKADAGIVKDGSSKVSRWEDQSGRSNDVEQATGANQPTWTDNILNTKPVVRFDGTSDKLMMSDRSDLKPSALTLVVVGKQTNTGAWAPYVVKSSSSYWTNGYGLTTSSYPSSAGMWVSSLSSGYVVPPVDTDYHTYFGRYAPGNGKVELYRDGVGLTPKSYSSAINHSTAALGIGGDGDLAYLGGDIAEVMIYNRALNDNERQDIEAYLYQKYTIGTQPTVATPTASVGSGTYSSAQTVTLSGPVGATIYYTTNGSTPTTSSTPYTVPVPISVTSTLKAIAVKDGYQVSPLLTKTYTIDGATSILVRSGLQLWLQADVGVTKDVSDKVSGWADQSRNENDAAQATSSNQPIWTSNQLGGMPVLRFDGVNDVLAVADTAGLRPTQVTMFVVGKQNSASGAALWGVYGQKDGWTGFGITRWGGANDIGFYLGDYTTGSPATNVTAGTYYLLAGRYDGTGSKLYVNGAVAASSATVKSVTYTAAPFTIGAYSNGGNPLNGDVAEVLVYNRALTDTERLQVEGYLNRKYSLNQATVSAPSVSVPTSTLSGPTQVAINVPSGYQVYYTLDGTDPTSASLLYTGPIDINYTQTLKAKVFLSGVAVSTTTTATYTLSGGPGYNPSDHTAPVIDLQFPTNAVLQ